MDMPFGKHRGQAIEAIPKGYLRWLRQNVRLSPWLETAVDCVLAGKPVPDDGDLDEQVHRIVRDAATQLQL